MAKKNLFQKKKIQDTKDSGFGNYDEGVGGGGSPNGPSQPSDHGHGVNSDYRQENNDTMQPRTNDGKFTYKSVNGQSINPKYGPSRGKTVNPLLTGGENGIMIEDVEQQFAGQSGKYWDKYKDKWYHKGGEFITSGDFKVRVAAETIWNVAKRRYDSVKGEFTNESSVFNETKKGRHSKEENAAIQKALASNEEQAVINQNTGGIKLKPGVVIQPPVQQPPVQQPTPQPGAQVGNTPVIPSNVGKTSTQPTVNVANSSVSDIINADYTPKYTDDDISQVRSILKEEGFTDDEITSFDSLSPKEKDSYIDKYFGDDEDETSTETSSATSDDSSNQPSANKKNSKEEDSEVVKKIKQMGFSN